MACSCRRPFASPHFGNNCLHVHKWVGGSTGGGFVPSSLRRTNIFHHVQRGRLLDIVMCDFLLREMQIHCQTGHKLEALRVTQLSSSGGSSSFVVSVAFPLQRGNEELVKYNSRRISKSSNSLTSVHYLRSHGRRHGSLELD